MKLLTKLIKTKMIRNHDQREKVNRPSPVPAVKIFNPCGGGTWLLTELDGDIMFGLCDLGMGFPELGYVSLSEMESVKGPFGIGLERDRWFKPTKSLSEYTADARQGQRIVA